MYQQSLSSAISVTNFGARGDSFTNDRAAFQRAIDSISGRATIYFPKGSYLSSGTFLINKNDITLLGDRYAKLLATGHADYRKIIISGANNIVVDGININGGFTGATDGEYGATILVIDSQNVHIKNCEIFNSLGLQISVQGSSKNVNITNNLFSGFHIAVHAAGTTNSKVPSGISVIGNTFYDSWAGTNHDFFGAVKLQAGLTPRVYSEGHIISQNKIYSAAQMGIEIWGDIKNTIISNNYIERSDFGISVANQSQNIIVANNNIKSCSLYGIEVADSKNVSVVGNSVDGASGTLVGGPNQAVCGEGIIINASENITVTSNNLRDMKNNFLKTFNTGKFIIFDSNTIDYNATGGNPSAINNQGSSVTTYSNNMINFRRSGAYFVFLDADGTFTNPSGVTLRNNDFNGHIDQWGILYYRGANTGSNNRDVLIENNKTIGVLSARYGMINTDHTPTRALHRNNYGPTGGGFSIPDYQIPGGSSPYGDTNLQGGFQYYGQYNFTVPTGGVTGDNAWICLWSGGLGRVNNVRLLLRNDSSISGNAQTTEVWASMIPYVGSPGNLTHTLMLPAQGTYFLNQFAEIRTDSHDDSVRNTIWGKLKPIQTGDVNKIIEVWYSDQSQLSAPFLKYGEPTWRNNSARVVIDSTNNHYLKLDKGLNINGVNIYSPASGNLAIAVTGSDKFVVTSGGRVGIGTSAPTRALEIAGTGGIRISQTATGSSINELYFQDGGQIRSSDDFHRIVFKRPVDTMEFIEYGDIVFSHGASIAPSGMVLKGSNQNVGIGVTNPQAKLHVNGAVRLDVSTTASANVGGGALPATPVGFLTINITGADFKIAYYNV